MSELQPDTHRTKKNLRATGFILIAVAMTLFLVDRFSHVISDTLGGIICGDRYMQPVNGIIGDMSCGFNLDMYVAVCLLLLCLAGVVLLSSSFLNKRNP
jgi:hypothetical protein